MDTRCSIRIHSKRTKLADTDGISCKAFVDGLRKAGVFVDDGTDYIKEISFTQELAKEDETIIDIYWEDMEIQFLPIPPIKEKP